MKTHKILFIASHRKNRAPGQRFRFEQFFDFLENNGFQCHLSSLISESDDLYIYKSGHVVRKIWFIGIKPVIIRFNDLLKANQYDIIFIFREAMMTRSIFFEKRFARSHAKIIYDFDDSIWLPNISTANKRFSWLKNAGKTASLIALSDMIFAGNAYLAAYAAKYNNQVKIIPTTIDTTGYIPVNKTLDQESPVRIGWSGSVTTIQHFNFIVPALRILREKYNDKISFEVIGDATYRNDDLGISGRAWKLEEETSRLATFDIGIMPLPDDEWAKGKCGLKGLQYMALAVPTIMSPVGVNTDIIRDGENGFLATTTEEWVTKLTRLIDDPRLRIKIGTAGRKTVEDHYSFIAWKDKYLELFRQLLT